MKRIFASVLILMGLSSAAWGANDFSGDANCVALWNFESGALTTDSIGTNTLTAVNTPVADTVNFQQGAASCDFELSDGDRFTIADAALDAGFPLKSGTTNKTISVVLWAKFESVGVEQTLFSKYFAAGGGRTLDLFTTSENVLSLAIGYNSGNSKETKTLATFTVGTGTWYSLAFTFDDVTHAWALYSWDGATAYTSSGTFTNQIYLGTQAFAVAANSDGAFRFDGLIDETVVFNDILTSAEIDQIRGGTYGASSNINNWWWRRRN